MIRPGGLISLGGIAGAVIVALPLIRPRGYRTALVVDSAAVGSTAGFTAGRLDNLAIGDHIASAPGFPPARGCTVSPVWRDHVLPTVRPGVRGLTLIVTVALAAAWLFAGARPAWGHAALVSSQPEPGTQLAAAPGVVTVRFSEPLILDLSFLRVTDPDGQVWERTSANERTMTANLDTTAQGVYLVEWKTVSPLDGHTLRGSFRFGVGVTP
ncbi:MAG: copper resistance protein CopC, partial [Actinomycetota bacterium]|nr:copper resistance protein CopC [Actinomycetota bacterium]